MRAASHEPHTSANTRRALGGGAGLQKGVLADRDVFIVMLLDEGRSYCPLIVMLLDEGRSYRPLIVCYCKRSIILPIHCYIIFKRL